MLFAQGCGLLFDWFAAPLAKLDAAETAVVVVIVLTMVSAGLLRGVALGAARDSNLQPDFNMRVF